MVSPDDHDIPCIVSCSEPHVSEKLSTLSDPWTPVPLIFQAELRDNVASTPMQLSLTLHEAFLVAPAEPIGGTVSARYPSSAVVSRYYV